ncbi:hypothetical protein BJF84_00135 [Rhodococcus sp. CUA-806]|nr:hypothetical protein BJF84_00135 [Rhodococcus sp. CUA-806]
MTRQKEDCQKLAERLGWTVGKVYEDNSVSAFKRKARPEWTAMLDDLRSGTRDGLIAYDLDRVARQPRDLEDLIDAVELKKIPTAVVTGDVDLGTDNGVFMARFLVNMANKSSRDTGRRVARAAQQRAEQGIPQKAKHRPFGYTADYAIVPDEAAMIRDAYKRVIAGENLTSITKSFAKFETVGGGRWYRGTVKKILQRAANAGIRTYKGTEVGSGNWEPIVDRKTYEAAMAVFESAAKPMPDMTNAHLLSSIARCGLCGFPMYGRRRNNSNKPQYVCMPTHGGCGRIARQKEPLDAFIEELVQEHIDRLVPPKIELDNTADEVASIESKIDELQQANLAGDISLRDFMTLVNGYREQLKSLQKAKAKAVGVQVSETFAEKFADGNLSQKRVIIKRYIEAIVINPTKKGARKLDYDAIQVLWK